MKVFDQVTPSDRLWRCLQVRRSHAFQEIKEGRRERKLLTLYCTADIMLYQAYCTRQMLVRTRAIFCSALHPLIIAFLTRPVSYLGGIGGTGS
jgi:hypothetical protein